MSTIVDELAELYDSGAFEVCRQKAQNALRLGVTEAKIFFYYGVSLARLGRWTEFASLVRNAGPQAIQLATWVSTELMKSRAYETVAAMDRAFSPQEPFWLIASYFSGCALMMQGQLSTALARFMAFRQAWPRFHKQLDFYGDDALNLIWRQARLIADSEEIARRRRVKTRLPALTFTRTDLGSAQRVIFTSGNCHYFNSMGRDFITGMIPFLSVDTILHLHVVDPDDQSRVLIDELAAEHGPRIAFSFEAEPLSRTYTYYACSRFYVMAALLDRYRAPVISFDIDIAPTQPVAPLFEVAAPFDFCCFKTTRDEPSSIYQASIMYWADRPTTRMFIDDLQHLCWEELGNPSRTSWMLDQAALFSLLSDPATQVRFGDYVQLTGRGLADTIRIAFDDSVKHQLRQRVQKNEPTVLTVAGPVASKP